MKRNIAWLIAVLVIITAIVAISWAAADNAEATGGKRDKCHYQHKKKCPKPTTTTSTTTSTTVIQTTSTTEVPTTLPTTTTTVPEDDDDCADNNHPGSEHVTCEEPEHPWADDPGLNEQIAPPEIDEPLVIENEPASLAFTG